LLGPRLGRGLAALRTTIESELADGTITIPEPNDGIASEVDAAVIASLAPEPDD
jgi:hypothetical protein